MLRLRGDGTSSTAGTAHLLEHVAELRDVLDQHGQRALHIGCVGGAHCSQRVCAVQVASLRLLACLAGVCA